MIKEKNMARRRMFSAELTSSDRFLDMGTDTQCFYFHLSLHADDEGFVSAPRSLGLLCGGTEANLKEMEEAGYIIRFSTGVLVIVDWMLNNTIRKDRSMETIHRKEKDMVTLVHNRYVLRSEIEDVSADMTTKMSTNLSTQNRIEDSRVDENRIEQNRIDKNISEYSSTEQYGGIGRHQEAFGVIAYDDNKYPDIITAF